MGLGLGLGLGFGFGFGFGFGLGSLGRVRKQRVPREVVCVGLDAW